MSSAEPPRLAHLLFFSLKDQGEAAQATFLQACQQYLDGHPGVVHFSAGRRGQAYDRPVNDTQYDIAVILVFDSEASHDRYQSSERHQQFLAQQSERWTQVRVFDALV